MSPVTVTGKIVLKRSDSGSSDCLKALVPIDPVMDPKVEARLSALCSEGRLLGVCALLVSETAAANRLGHEPTRLMKVEARR